MSKKVLIATSKPFAAEAVEKISAIFSKAGYSLQRLEKYSDPEDFKKAAQNSDAIIVRSDQVTADIINSAQQLKIVVRAGAGFDNVDLKAATEKKIVVMNTPGQNANAVAELVFGLMLNLARRNYTGQSGTELLGKKLGIHAYGNVGSQVSRIAKGFGMEVYAYDPFIPQDTMTKAGVIPVDSCEKLYSLCDYISLHLPKMKETIKSINYSLLSMMKPGASLINTARAEVINEDDLVRVFTEGRDLRYASDIAPECKDQLLQKFADRIFFTAKKLGAQTAEANINAGIAAANQIIDFFENKNTRFQVNR
jgi:D-3-phosphoglycerate dehydrogenase